MIFWMAVGLLACRARQFIATSAEVAPKGTLVRESYPKWPKHSGFTINWPDMGVSCFFPESFTLPKFNGSTFRFYVQLEGCTTVDGRNPAPPGNNGINDLPIGAGFLPSTVLVKLRVRPWKPWCLEVFLRLLFWGPKITFHGASFFFRDFSCLFPNDVFTVHPNLVLLVAPSFFWRNPK